MGVDHRMGELVINKSWRVGDLALLGGSTCRRRRRYRRRRIFQSEGVDRSWGVKDTIMSLLSFSGRCRCVLGLHGIYRLFLLQIIVLGALKLI